MCLRPTLWPPIILLPVSTNSRKLGFHLSALPSTASWKKRAVPEGAWPYVWIGLSAHSPVRPSCPQVRMSSRALLASAGVHLKPRIPAVRSAPKIPSSCSTVSFEIGLSLLTKTTMPFDLPSASKAPEATVIAVGA